MYDESQISGFHDVLPPLMKGLKANQMSPTPLSFKRSLKLEA